MPAHDDDFFIDFSGGEGLASWPGMPRAVHDRYDKGLVDLAAVLDALLGEGVSRDDKGGEEWWPCPYHPDVNPSLGIVPSSPHKFKCLGCGAHGDAIDIIKHVNRCTFEQARDWLRANHFLAPSASRPASPPRTAEGAPPRPGRCRTIVSHATAVRIATEGFARLKDGSDLARWGGDYLRRRGLADRTTRAAWVGIGVRNKSVELYIPWAENDGRRLVGLKKRLMGPTPAGTRYAWVYRDNPTVYPDPAAIKPGKPLIVVEGEFDCLLIQQEIGDLATTITLGSASGRPGPAVLEAAALASRVFVATDNDPAGDEAATAWPAATRIVPPAGTDWTDVYLSGHDLRAFWTSAIGGR
jgi:hypothetical protein